MKLRIALADLSYLNAENAGNLYVPLSIGFLAATAKKRFGPDVEVRIFKDPLALLEYCRDAHPRIVGLSLYHWSLGLSDMVARKIAAMTPRPLLVGGGPCIDSDAVEQAKFLARHPALDIVVPNEGEDAFCSIVADVLGGGSGLVKPPLGLSTDLAQVPSPYLDGTLDEFLDGRFQPMTQTSRLCPYTCAFCVSGKSRGKLRAFELDQLREEMLYIGRRFADWPQHILYLTDENFGIMARDLQVADMILEARAKTGYPRKIFYYQDKRFTHIARELHEKVGDMCYHGCMLSLQSENPETLKAIKRRNLTDEQITDAIAWAHRIGIKTSTELIFGLPMETRESFTGLLDKCARHGFDAVQCYNLILFDGIEMNRPAYRAEHQLETRWRSIANHQQMVDGEAAIEFEEVVISSNHFSFEDYKLIRKLNVFFHAFFVGQVCTDVVRGLIAGGVGLTDIVKTLLDNPVNEAHRAFLADLDAEVGGALFTIEQRDAVRAAGKLLPPHIKIQPHFAARIERERDVWLAEALERSSRMVYEVAAE